MTGNELVNIAEAHFTGQLSGDGSFTSKCHDWIEQQTRTQKALMTHSCTAALEMCALLVDVQAGDEVIMPSFTFVSTANAFVLRGAVPVFVDIRSDTGNIDETLIEAAITPRTKAIVVVHYAGVGCNMDSIMSIAERHNLPVIEDAAQGIMSFYKGKALGSIGQLGAFSFHETKNVISGEGGALLINDPRRIKSAEIIREKGTDRSQFMRGAVDKYTWQSVGSSFLPGELIAAFLYAQLEQAKDITEKRLRIWNIYYTALESLEWKGVLRRPIIPYDCQHNGHIFYILVDNESVRNTLLDKFRSAGVGAIFHYIPLHDSPAGLKFGRACGDLSKTKQFAGSLIRLPMWVGLPDSELAEVVKVISDFFS
jgi:dTDP-4-amino-4,6-dideoxygalactose transaminase